MVSGISKMVSKKDKTSDHYHFENQEYEISYFSYNKFKNLKINGRKNELSSLEPHLIATTRNSHLRLWWWSRELQHIPSSLPSDICQACPSVYTLRFDMALRLAFPWPKQVLGVVDTTYWKNFMKLLLSLQHCLPTAVMIMEANAEMKFPSA